MNATTVQYETWLTKFTALSISNSSFVGMFCRSGSHMDPDLSFTVRACQSHARYSARQKRKDSVDVSLLVGDVRSLYLRTSQMRTELGHPTTC